MRKREKNHGKALRDARNLGLEKEQERLTKPEHHTPEESEGGNPDRSAARRKGADPASPDLLKNPPQVEGPRERGNDMV